MRFHQIKQTVSAENFAFNLLHITALASVQTCFTSTAGRAEKKLTRSQATAAPAQVGTPVTEEVVIPGGKGKATPVKKGEVIKVTNTHGTQASIIAMLGRQSEAHVHQAFVNTWHVQVVDFWAFSTAKFGQEIMSMHHTRNALTRLIPRVSCYIRGTRHLRQVCRVVPDILLCTGRRHTLHSFYAPHHDVSGGFRARSA